VRERLLSASEADIAEHLRRKGCVGDAALRGSDQGEPAQRGSPTKGFYFSGPFTIPNSVQYSVGCVNWRMVSAECGTGSAW